MKRLIKKVSLLIASVMILTIVSIPQVYATEKASNISLSNSIDQYAESVLKSHLNAFGFYGSYNMSNLFNIYNEDMSLSNRKICYVFSNDSLVGELIIGINNNQFNSSFSLKNDEIIEDAIKNNENVMFYTDNGILNIRYNDRSYIVYSEYSDNASKSLKSKNINWLNDESIYQKAIIVSNTIDASSNLLRASNAFYPNVRVVANSYTYDSSGQCAESCMASVFMFHGKGTNLTSDIVYQKILATYGNVGSGATKYTQGFSCYGLTANHISSGMTFNDISTTLETNRRTIIMRLTRDGGTHAMVLCGWYFSSGTDVYYLMDPTTNSTISVSVNSSVKTNPSDFRYITGTRTYTWTSSVTS